MKKPDTFLNTYHLKYSRRKDFQPTSNESFTPATYGSDILLKGRLKSASTNNSLNYQVNYRDFNIKDSSAIRANTPKKSITGRLEGDYSFFDEIIETSTYYELGSGKERRTEYQFVRVRGEGRGNYVWNDYNNNNSQELNEFEPATQSNDYKANFIRVLTPSTNYVRSISNNLRENLVLDFTDLDFNNNSTLTEFITSFSNESNISVSRKALQQEDWKQYFPLKLNVADSTLVKVNAEFKNTIHYNKTDPDYGLYYSYRNSKNKQLRLRGFDTRTLEEHQIHGRINFSRNWSFFPEYLLGLKTFSSDFFDEKEFHIDYDEISGNVSYQPTGKIRLSLIYAYEKQQNQAGANEQLLKHKGSFESTFNFIGKGRLRARLNFINMNFDGQSNSPIGYEMLQGLNKGVNWTWLLSGNYKLKDNIQLNIQYNGRTGLQDNVIHQANVSAQYLF